ncbi:PaaI family thioesterase [Aestuariibius sp. 2305UL40-4]|uniref:PaaI family thioesterase n=1 Tax=Aestuariibius violaceus TaxID=3234132 RepID=UPI00345EDEB2
MFHAQSPADLPDLEQVRAMTGLQFMESIRDGRMSAPPIAKVLNYALDVVEDGRVVFRGTPGFEVTNPLGTVHGGWYGTLLDSCMACAVMTKIPAGATYTTLEYKINITRGIPLGTEIFAEGNVQHVGRSTGVASGEIRDAAGKLYATGSTTCIIMPLPKAG